MGFVINPYDRCVTKKMINGYQMTICWHVNDLKVSDKDPAIVSAFLLKLSDIYGEKMTVTRGKFMII